MKNLKEIVATLARIRQIAKTNGGHIIRSQQMQRKDRELLVRTQWLQEIIKGWYLLTKPDLAPGDSSAWYANFWDFLRIYLSYHFGNDYCLSAENSLDLHTACSTIPQQVIVISAKGGGVPQPLPYQTSIFVYSDPQKIPEERTDIRGLQVMTLPYALCRVSSAYFKKNSSDAEIALQLISRSSELSEIILKYNLKTTASRLMGAFEFLGNQTMAEDISKDLAAWGLNIKPENPFQSVTPSIPFIQLQSPYVGRILSLWKDYREKVIPYFKKAPGMSKNKKALSTIEDLYEKDAYNSLSIEGYQVDEELILRVQNNHWNPDLYPSDQQERNALAARGYYEAFLEVKKSISRIIKKEKSGKVVEQDLKRWYQSLFAPCAKAGIIRPEDLLGYRKNQVYIRHSRHIPLPKEALVDAMDTLFECLKTEKNPAVRAVLGHYVFVYIHPYMDGNGRIGRFLMNVMLTSGGYPWTIIQVKNRTSYLQALEMASTHQNIEPFAKFISKEMSSR